MTSQEADRIARFLEDLDLARERAIIVLLFFRRKKWL